LGNSKVLQGRYMHDNENVPSEAAMYTRDYVVFDAASRESFLLFQGRILSA